ncbi:hypothetical protein AKO1_006871 [Acrasis kona]|uniref:Uncharacterized protein n=1 Tax=Acrasis kona TaxID=1008807 RepID=A0AAW2YU95_9EUKA
MEPSTIIDQVDDIIAYNNKATNKVRRHADVYEEVESLKETIELSRHEDKEVQQIERIIVEPQPFPSVILGPSFIAKESITFM